MRAAGSRMPRPSMRILGQDPRRSDVFHRIGVDAVDKGDCGAGAALIRKPIEANPAVASYHVDLAGFGSTDCRVCPAHLLTVRLSRP